MEYSSQNADTDDVFITSTKRRGRPKKEVSSGDGSSLEGSVVNAKNARTSKQ